MIRSTIFIRKVTTVVIGSLLLAGLLSTTAHAKTIYDSNGCSGSTSSGVASGTQAPFVGNTVNVNPMWVYRSPCYSGTQRVQVTYRKWGYTSGRWVNYANITISSTLAPPGQVKNFKTPLEWWPVLDTSLDVIVRWYNNNNGNFLAKRRIDYDATRDYNCPLAGGLRQCTVHASPEVGAFIHFFN